MKISLNWVKDYVDLDGIDVKWLTDRFTVTTAEIEEVVKLGEDIKEVIIAKIIDIMPHPTSEKLKLIKVWTGEEEVQSVCGAPNIYVGMIIAFGMIGGSIKGISEIKANKVQEVESFGVACSERELGISNEHLGLIDLGVSGKVGEDIKAVIPIDDYIIEIDNKSLTNRPDLWCHYGIAREIAAITGRKLKGVDAIKEEELKVLAGEKLDIEILDSEKCLRYSALAIKGVKPVKSPITMLTRLHYCGLKPINHIVDLSNYVMLDVGQPMHTFDAEVMKSVVVYSTEKETTFTTLDKAERVIPQNTLMIGKKRGEGAAVAGIMGGANSEITEETTSLLLEAATFEGVCIRKTSSSLGLRTDASIRYEKFLDTSITTLAIGRFVKLLKEHQQNASIASALYDNVLNRTKSIHIDVDHSFIQTYLGDSIEKQEVIDILRSLEFGICEEKGIYHIEIPTFRATKDVTLKVDIVEEILRVHGYNKIKSQPRLMPVVPITQDSMKTLEYAMKDLLTLKYSFHELHSYCWFDSEWLKKLKIDNVKEALRISNSNIKQFEQLRTSLMPNLLQAAFKNKKSYKEFKLYEVGRIFIKQDVDCVQDKYLGVIAYNENGKSGLKEEFLKLKGICDELLLSAKNIAPQYKTEGEKLDYVDSWADNKKLLHIYLSGKFIGYIAALNPTLQNIYGAKANVVMLELNLQSIDEIEGANISYEEPSKFPQSYLDFTLISERDKAYSEIENAVKDFKASNIIGVHYISTYEGENLPAGKKSTTFRMHIGSKEKTLELCEIQSLKDEFLSHVLSRGMTINY